MSISATQNKKTCARTPPSCLGSGTDDHDVSVDHHVSVRHRALSAYFAEPRDAADMFYLLGLADKVGPIS